MGLFHRLFDSSPAQVAILDFTGTILKTNRAWQQYGRDNGLPESYDCIGKNYLTICSNAVAQGDIDAQRACVGLLDVMHRKRSKFTMTYPCHGPNEPVWSRLWIEPQLPEIPVIVIAHYRCVEEPNLIRPGSVPGKRIDGYDA